MHTTAFVAISLSTAAVLACLLTVPTMFHYVLKAESYAQGKLDGCVVMRRARLIKSSQMLRARS